MNKTDFRSLINKIDIIDEHDGFAHVPVGSNNPANKYQTGELDPAVFGTKAQDSQRNVQPGAGPTDKVEVYKQNPGERQEAIRQAWLHSGYDWQKYITDPEDVKMIASSLQGIDSERYWDAGIPRPSGYERGTGKPMKGAEGVKTREELGLGPAVFTSPPKQTGREGEGEIYGSQTPRPVGHGREPGRWARLAAAQAAGFASLADARDGGHPAGSEHTWTGSGAFEWTGYTDPNAPSSPDDSANQAAQALKQRQRQERESEGGGPEGSSAGLPLSPPAGGGGGGAGKPSRTGGTGRE